MAAGNRPVILKLEHNLLIWLGLDFWYLS